VTLSVVVHVMVASVSVILVVLFIEFCYFIKNPAFRSSPSPAFSGKFHGRCLL